MKSTTVRKNGFQYKHTTSYRMINLFMKDSEDHS